MACTYFDYIYVRKRFTAIARNGGISKSAAFVYEQLFEEGNRRLWPERFRMRHEKLAQMACVCLKTLRRCLKELMSAGVIMYELGSGRRETEYHIVDLAPDNHRDKPNPPSFEPEYDSEYDRPMTSHKWLAWCVSVIRAFKPLKHSPNFRFDQAKQVGDYLQGLASLNPGWRLRMIDLIITPQGMAGLPG